MIDAQLTTAFVVGVLVFVVTTGQAVVGFLGMRLVRQLDDLTRQVRELAREVSYLKGRFALEGDDT